MSTTIIAILTQRAGLCRSALLRTRDVNEAYLAVHAVMTRALSQAGGSQRDLERDLAYALYKRAAVLGAAA